MASRTITACFAVVTCLYGILLPFLILFTNVVWTTLWKPEDITAWMIVVTVYFLPMHVVPVVAWAWHTLGKQNYEQALILLFTPAIIITFYIFTIPMIEDVAVWFFSK